MRITKQHRALIVALRQVLFPWRKLTIAVDGVDNSGKSTLARFLSWQLGLPTIETDLLIQPHNEGFTYDYSSLDHLIRARHERNRPVIIEGLCVLQTLSQLNINTDYLIYVKTLGNPGSFTWRKIFKAYEQEFHPQDQANFIFRRRRR
jgi:uridine kinase